MLARLKLVTNVLRHQYGLVHHPLLVMEAREGGLELPIQPFESRKQLCAASLAGGLLPAGKRGIGLPVQAAHLFHQPAQGFQVSRAALDQLVQDDSVKPFLGRHGQEFLRHRNVLFARETKGADNPARFPFRRFNALAGFHLLLARQQRRLAHLPQIHPHRIIQNIEAAGLFVFVPVARAAPVHLGGINDVNLQGAQLGQHLIQVGRGDEVVGQGIVKIVIGQVALFLGQTQQVFDFLGEVQARLASHRAEGRLGIGEAGVLRGVLRAGNRAAGHGGGGRASRQERGRFSAPALLFESSS